MNINYKYILLGTIGIGFLMDAFNEGLMSVGIILGWLIGLMTMTQWEMKKQNKQENSE